MERPLIGVVNAANEVVPGHMHLDRIAEAVKADVVQVIGSRFVLYRPCPDEPQIVLVR